MPDATPAAPVAAPAAAPAPAAPPAGGTPPAVAPAAAPKATPEEQTTALTEEPKPEGSKDAPKDQPKGDDAPKGDFQIKVPDGVNVDPGMITEYTKFAQESGLSQEAAQKTLDFYVKQEQALAEKYQVSQKDQYAKWLTEAKQDKDIGGSKWDGTIGDAKRAINQFATPELKQILNRTGLGNHKDVISFFAKAGRALAEDKLPKGASASGDAAETVPLEVALYPTMQK